MGYALIDEFESLFNGKRYIHRNQTHGLGTVLGFYEDLLASDPKSIFAEHVASGGFAIATQFGGSARKGLGAFGSLSGKAQPSKLKGGTIPRGRISRIEIGVESKIMAKAMMKQVGRVGKDLATQSALFRERDSKAITACFVGINNAPFYRSYEGARSFRTGEDGGRHPIQEAEKALGYLQENAAGHFDVFLPLKFYATNESPYPFQWSDLSALNRDYGEALDKVLQLYKERF